MHTAGRRAVSHCQKHHQPPTERKNIKFIEPDMASKESEFEPGKLCGVGSPAAANVLR